jgi:carboxypeptidase family protein/TonB-dependent receptor-like protein
MKRLSRNRGTIAGLVLGVSTIVLLGGTRESVAAQTSVALARLQGIVFDSIGNRPLGGALVQLIELPPGHGAHAATSDSLGRFQMDSVAPGSYMAGFLHPLLDSLGIAAPNEEVVVRDGASVRIALAVPSARHVARAICGNDRAAGAANHGGAGDSLGMIIGHVRDVNSGAPLPGTAVTLQWQTLVLGSGTAHTQLRSLRATTVGEGWFAMCDLAPDDYQLHAENGRRETGLLDVEVHPREIVRLSLLLAPDSGAVASDSLPGGGATLSGTILSHDKRPLEGAQVAVDGSSASAITDRQGAFRLSGLPAGTRMAEARALGYAPVRVRVELSRTEPTTVSMVMSKQVATLDAVTVYGSQSRRMRDVTGFLDRKRRGFGHFITQDEIDRSNEANTCDLLRHVVGLNVRDVAGGGCTANIRGATSGGLGQGMRQCEPKVYQDNVPFGGTLSEFSQSMSPHDIMGVEVYSTASEPPQFQSSCGVIVVWTRSGA